MTGRNTRSQKCALKQVKREIIEPDDSDQHNGLHKNAVSNNGIDEWTNPEILKLVKFVDDQLNDTTYITCCRRIALLNWTKVSSLKKTKAECSAFVRKIVSDVPRFRTLKEVLAVYKTELKEQITKESLGTASNLTDDPVNTNIPMKRKQPLDEVGYTNIPMKRKQPLDEVGSIASKKGSSAQAQSARPRSKSDDRLAKKSKKRGASTKVQSEPMEMASDDSTNNSVDNDIPENRKRKFVAPKKKSSAQAELPQTISKAHDNIPKKSKKRGATPKVKSEPVEMTTDASSDDSSDNSSDDQVDNDIPKNRKKNIVAPKKINSAQAESVRTKANDKMAKKSMKRGATIKVKSEPVEMTTDDSSDDQVYYDEIQSDDPTDDPLSSTIPENHRKKVFPPKKINSAQPESVYSSKADEKMAKKSMKRGATTKIKSEPVEMTTDDSSDDQVDSDDSTDDPLSADIPENRRKKFVAFKKTSSAQAESVQTSRSSKMAKKSKKPKVGAVPVEANMPIKHRPKFSKAKGILSRKNKVMDESFQDCAETDDSFIDLS